MRKWEAVCIEEIPSPLDQETYQTLLDEIAELLYVEDRQLENLEASSKDLSFENGFELREVIP